jgi:hypothetical protein
VQAQANIKLALEFGSEFVIGGEKERNMMNE